MNRVALVVEFGVKPGLMDDFRGLMEAHARTTLRSEPGCLQFELLTPVEVQLFDGSVVSADPNTVMLFEAYEDEAAFKAHNESPHLPETRAAYADMITSRRIVRCTTPGGD